MYYFHYSLFNNVGFRKQNLAHFYVHLFLKKEDLNKKGRGESF